MPVPLRSWLGSGAVVFTHVLIWGLMPLHVVAVDEDDAQLNQIMSLNAPQAVREGNRLLLQGDPAAALEAYRHAETLKPDAAEIAFVEGLAHFDLKQFNEARMAFQQAAAARNRRLANGALYSLGTCDHAQALEKLDRPQEAVGLLESAMRRYHEVLADDPNHRHAKDANFKAAAMWRQIREMMQQQQQQQQQPDPGDKGSDDPQDQERVEPDEQPHDEHSPQEPPAQEQLPQQPQDADDEQQQSAPSQPQEGDQTEDQEAADRSEESSDDPDRTAAPAAGKQVTREQAERRLREMMQNIRERKKVRPESPEPVSVRPVEKDW